MFIPSRGSPSKGRMKKVLSPFGCLHFSGSQLATNAESLQFQCFFCATNQCSFWYIFETYTNVARHPLKGNPQFIATNSCLCFLCDVLGLDSDVILDLQTAGLCKSKNGSRQSVVPWFFSGFSGGHSGGDFQDKLEGFFWLFHRDVRCSELWRVCLKFKNQTSNDCGNTWYFRKQNDKLFKGFPCWVLGVGQIVTMEFFFADFQNLCQCCTMIVLVITFFI